MTTAETVPLSEHAENMAENVAIRIARRFQGRVTANHLLPYLPMSLALLRRCLDGMVDGAAVTREESHVPVYVFAAYTDEPASKGPLKERNCVACDADLAKGSVRVFCGACMEKLERELTTLAEQMGWPAQAVYEHELAWLAAQQDGPVRAEDLAARSRYTMRRVTQKLDRMSLEGALEKQFDEAHGAVVYAFPEIRYEKAAYRANRDVIGSHPASVMEDVQIRLTHILFALGGLVLVLFALAFLHVPFILLVLAFFTIGPVLAVALWRRRTAPPELDE